MLKAPSWSRKFKALVAAGACSVLAASGASPLGGAPAAAATGRPNVLIIITDDQRFDSLVVQPKTLARIGDRGVRFTNAFATTPACCPSRASIFTGRYVHNHGVLTNDGETTANLDHTTTLQARLQAEGYRTGLFGKYLNRWPISAPLPYFHNWAFVSGGSDFYYHDGIWNVDGRLREVPKYSTRFIEEQAIDFISRAAASGSSWLSFVTFTAPHAPFTPEDRYKAAPVPRFDPDPAVEEEDRSDKPSWVEERETPIEVVMRQRRRQLRTLMSVDDSIRRIMRELQLTDQAGNTLVFFLSDNGYLHGEHSLQGKTTPYLPSVRIPLMMRWPAAVPAGAVDDRMVANIDIAPTVMDALELPVDPAEMDGRSLLDDSWSRDRLLLEYWARERRPTPDWGAMITADQHYIEYYQAEDYGGDPIFAEYYNLDTDPYQLENLIPELPVGAATLPVISQQLDADRHCRGTQGDNACP